MIQRDVYSFVDWIQEIGGFFTAVRVFFYLIVPWLEIMTLEKYLIRKMYKRQFNPPESRINPNHNPDKQLIKSVSASIQERKPIKANYHNYLITVIKSYFCCCLSQNEDDIYYAKARIKLSSELDVKRMLQSLRNLENTVKILTSKRERRLVRMQDDKNVIRLNDLDYHHLRKNFDDYSLNDLQKLNGDSSEFGTDDFLDYSQDLQKKIG